MDINSIIGNYENLIIFELNYRNKNRLLRLERIFGKHLFPKQYKTIYLTASL